MGPCRGRDGPARVEEFRQGRRACKRHVERVILRREDEAIKEVGRCATDLGEVAEGFRRLDQREDGDGVSLCGGSAVRDHVADKGEVAGRVDFRDDEGGQVRGLEDSLQVGEGEAAAHAVDADCAFADVTGGGERDFGGDEGAGVGFLGGGYAVFQVVSEAVGCQGAGFVEVALGGAGDCGCWLGLGISGRGLGTIEHGSAEDVLCGHG